MNINLLEYALRYASIGWKIFPLAPGQKIPITSHGVKDATNDEEKIRAWWAKWPNANIAVACGAESGVYVVDVDVDQIKGVDGLSSLKEFPPLPDTIRQDTPRSGFHAFYKTSNPPANRNSFRPGIDIRGDGYYVVLAPSIHPNSGRYAWSPGAAPWERRPEDYPNFMRPVTRAPWATPAGTRPGPTPAQHSDDTIRRASLYLAQCDPAVQGQAGHDKLLWAAVALVHGFLLSDGQALDLLIREFNPRCVPPWDFSIPKDEKDFRRKVTEARKLTPRERSGWLLDDPAYAPAARVAIDLKSLLSKTLPQQQLVHTTTEASPSSELHFLTRPTGLLGEITSWINGTSIREQPFLALACTLTFLGALFGRKIKDHLGSRTNIYCMGIAPSSAGKAHAMNQIRRLCAAAECSDLLGGDDIASDSAIEDRIDRKPATLFLWDEIGHLLAHIKSGTSKHHAMVVSLLMKLYSAAGNMYLGREYAENENQRVIVQPCCCIYGTSTPERFAGGISPEELQDGWLSRCLVFYSPMSPAKCRGRYSETVPAGIVSQVKAWYARGEIVTDTHTVSQIITPPYGKKAPPEQILITSDEQAERIFISFDDESVEYGKGHPQLACLWAKSEENARRVALIIAAGESFDNPSITPSIADYSCRLIRYLLLSFGTVLAPEIVSSRIEHNKREIVAIIGRSGVKGCPKREITKSSHWADKRGRDNMLDDLLESGDIARQAEGKTFRYWTAEHLIDAVAKGLVK